MSLLRVSIGEAFALVVALGYRGSAADVSTIRLFRRPTAPPLNLYTLLSYRYIFHARDECRRRRASAMQDELSEAADETPAAAFIGLSPVPACYRP